MKWIDVAIFGYQVKIAFEENSIHIYNAFPVKDNLKKRGYRWNSDDKSWFLTSRDSSLEIKELTGTAINTPDPAEDAVKLVEDGSKEHTQDSYSVLELRNYLDNVLKDTFSASIWVRGVIASEVKDYRWLSYFDLRDEDETKNLFFKCEIRPIDRERIVDKLKKLNVCDKLEKDLPVFFLVKVALSNRYSVDFRLKISDVLPEYTKSKLKSQLDITLDKLKQEGILENQKSLQLPPLVNNVGLITSEKGTSTKDILAGLHPFENRYNFYFIDSRMEGENAVAGIIKSITFFEKMEKELALDAIVIARGGGSEQSLAVFNDLLLCRKICLCSLPVIAAIGHEKDISALEICSFFSPTPSTPSGTGKFLQNLYLNLEDELVKKTEFLIRYLEVFNTREVNKLISIWNGLDIRLNNLLDREKRDLFVSISRYNQAGRYRIQNASRKLKVFQQLINSGVVRIFKGRVSGVFKTLKKLDFEQLLQRNESLRSILKDRSRYCYNYSQKTHAYVKKELKAKVELIESNNPDRILRKGFSLTLNEQNKIIKSKKDFNQEAGVRIRFFDGITKIIKRRTGNE
jgi:exodeoxyribonuclease VII large subunit